MSNTLREALRVMPNRHVLGEIIDDIEVAVTDDDKETALEQLQKLRDELRIPADDVFTVGVHVDVWSYDYKDDVYYLITGYDSETEAVEAVVADDVSHLVTPQGDPGTKASSMRENEHAVTRNTYREGNPDAEVSIHADVYYLRANVGDSGNLDQASASEIVEAVEYSVESE